ncbi:MAG: nucleotidyltransferase domain-containing protein [candidate division WOR-3 bacterium]
MARNKEQLKDAIKSVTADALGDEVAALVLYGSYAVGQETEYSDIDLLIVVERQFESWRERRQCEIALRKAFYRLVGQVSPVVLSVNDLDRALESSYPLLLEILETGRVLFDKGCFADVRAQFDQLKQGALRRSVDRHWQVMV